MSPRSTTGDDPIPLRILLAPNAFKGTFSAVRVAEIWASALADVEGVETVSRPLSDGGDGALEVWERLLEGAARVWFVARDPLGLPRRVPALWVNSERAGYIETALASGLALVADEARDPLNATSRGTGQLLAGLLDMGAAAVTVGLGGSATVDGGLGLARELGYRFVNGSGAEVETPAELADLVRIVPPASRPWERARIRALCDVRNPLLGPSGAARVFGPQKFRPGDPRAGAGLERLARGLERLAARMREDLGVDLAGQPGAGAAGGLGAGLIAFAGARLGSGSAHFIEAAGIAALLVRDSSAGVDGVLTGEGSYDAQSAEGKLAGELLAMCTRAGLPLAVVAGQAPGGGGGLILSGAALGRQYAALDESALGELAVQAVRRIARDRSG